MSEVEAGDAIAPENDATVADEATPQTEESTPQTDEQSGVQKRINQLTWEKHEAQRRADAAEAKLKEKERPAEPKPTGLKAPVPSDFDTDEEYSAALESYTVETHRTLTQQAQTDAEQRQQAQERATKKDAYQARVAEYAAEHEGFVEAVSSTQIPISESVEQVLFESERGPELTHWLAENAAEAIRINNLPPILAAKELGRIEASLDAVAPKKVSDAPPPDTELSGADTAPEGLSDDLDIDEWMKRRRAQLKERGKL